MRGRVPTCGVSCPPAHSGVQVAGVHLTRDLWFLHPPPHCQAEPVLSASPPWTPAVPQPPPGAGVFSVQSCPAGACPGHPPSRGVPSPPPASPAAKRRADRHTHQRSALKARGTSGVRWACLTPWPLCDASQPIAYNLHPKLMRTRSHRRTTSARGWEVLRRRRQSACWGHVRAVSVAL